MHNSAADQVITSLQTEEVIPDLSVLYSLIDREWDARQAVIQRP